MNTIDEHAIREQLTHAVAPLDPAAPPLDALRARAARRRRLHYAAWSGAVGVTAAVVAVVLIVVPGGGSSRAKIGFATAPSSDGLKAYAAAHGGKHVAGPIESGSGYYGAYATKNFVEIAKYVDDSWEPDGSLHRPHGSGAFILRLSDGGDVIAGEPSFLERDKGGDVTYFGGVFYRDSGVWKDAKFARCGNKELSCWYRGTAQPYGHVVNGAFVSIHNDCTPYCAAGTDYRISWRWDAETQRFKVDSVRALSK